MLQNIDISQFLVANSIKTEEELMAKAQEQFAEGKEDLKKFILSKSPKDLQDLATTTREMEEAATNIRRKQKQQTKIIRETLEKECVEECCGRWYRCSLEVLQRNSLEPVAFTVAMREPLTKGRAKFSSILIAEPANRGKTFFLSPSQKYLIL